MGGTWPSAKGLARPLTYPIEKRPHQGNGFRWLFFVRKVAAFVDEVQSHIREHRIVPFCVERWRHNVVLTPKYLRRRRDYLADICRPLCLVVV